MGALLERSPRLQQDSRTKWGRTPLMLAVTSGNAEAVELLMGRIDDDDMILKDEADDTALTLAMKRDTEEIARMLLRRSGAAQVEFDDCIAMFIAVGRADCADRVSKIGLLLEHSADAQVTATFSGDTALMTATREGHVEVARLLLQHKAEAQVLAPARDGDIPLIHAVANGRTDIARLLLRHGAAAQAAYVTAEGDTALSVAADEGEYEPMHELLLAAPGESFRVADLHKALRRAANDVHFLVRESERTDDLRCSQLRAAKACLAALLATGRVDLFELRDATPEEQKAIAAAVSKFARLYVAGKRKRGAAEDSEDDESEVSGVR
jgi:hypothetical protein